jgi:hypothetical protein
MLAPSLLFLGAVIGLVNTQTIVPTTVPISLRGEFDPDLKSRRTLTRTCIYRPVVSSAADHLPIDLPAVS